jgi:pimeloyl-ACP methyl ester carboxylesterase
MTLGRALKYIAALLPSWVCGCWTPPRATPSQVSHGMVWIFPGVEGGQWSVRPAYRALRDAGVDAAIEVFDWQRFGGTLANLMDYEGNRSRAQAVADQIALYAAAHPGGPIDLVGYSGGGGMAVFVAEALPPEVRLRHVVLVQPALSPDYNLTTALRHLDGQLYHFYSPQDWVILGAGTEVWGTMDRANVESSGKVGFDAERAVPDPALRARLVQRRWEPEMRRSGHFGGHIPILGYEWNRTYVAPLLAPAPTSATASAGRPPTPPAR